MATTRFRAPFAVISVAAAGVLLASCSVGGGADVAGGGEPAEVDGPLAEMYEAAKEEGVVVWYTSFIPDNIEQIEPAFEEQFPGVDLQVLRLGGTEGPIRFSSEVKSGASSADVLTTSEIDFGDEAKENGWTDDLSTFDLPTLADYPEDFVRGPLAVTQVAPIRVTYNTELVETPPTSWEDLLDPEYADQLMLVDPSAILPWMGQYYVLKEEFGIEYLEQLADNGYRLVDSAVPASQSLSAGEGKGVFPSLDSVANPLIAEGAPVENAVLAPYTGVENSSMISSSADHPEAARLFTSWLLSPEGQSAVNSGFAASPLDDVPDTETVDEGYVPLDAEAVAGARDEILGALGMQ